MNAFHLFKLLTVPILSSLFFSFSLLQFELEQDNAFFDKDFGEMKSSKKKDEQNPVYGEDFHFNIPTLNNMELKIKVRF